MEKRNWKHNVTLKQRMVLCLAAFFAAFALQLALNGYQARAVQQVQDDQMGNFNAISRFQGGVESSISILEAYRWENGETEEMLEKLQAACSTSNAWLWRIRSNMDGLQNVSDEQWVLYGAVETTYGSYNTLLDCNWKIALDAFSEAYHVSTIHAGSFPNVFSSGLSDVELFGEHRTTGICLSLNAKPTPVAGIANSITGASLVSQRGSSMLPPGVNPNRHDDFS